MPVRDVGIVKVCIEHVTDGSTMVVAVDYDENERNPHHIDNVIDEASGFAAFHAVYICRDAECAGCCLIEREPVKFRTRMKSLF